MHRPTRPRLRTLSLTLALGVLVALCGASAAHATDPEDCSAEPADTVSSGRIALFDVYWNTETKTLVNNPCPPTVVHTPAGFDPATRRPIPATTTRTASKIHIDHTIIHIPESAKRTVTASGTDAYNGTKYAFLRPVQDDGTRAASADVYIVPSCAFQTIPAPTSTDTLCLEFSAGLLQPQDWSQNYDSRSRRNSTGEVQYEVKSIHQPGQAVQSQGTVYVFKTYSTGVYRVYTPQIIWNSELDSNNELRAAFPLTYGTYESPYWAFTEPGTYEISVRAKGHPNGQRTGGPIVNATTVTSEVRTYTFHVGDLTLVEPPQFQVERSVRENAAAGTNVGDPIAVAVADDSNPLDYWLTGEGSLPFDVTSVADGAQITVATGASLDYETTPTYDLTLNVSDDLGRTGYIDLATDHTLGVHIALEDENETPSVVLSANTTTPVVGNTLTLTATVSNSPVASEDLRYTWYNVLPRKLPFTTTTPPTVGIVSTFSGERRYSVRAWYTATDGTVVGWDSNEIAVTWSN